MGIVVEGVPPRLFFSPKKVISVSHRFPDLDSKKLGRHYLD